MRARAKAILTVDLEDYRRQQLRDAVGGHQPPHAGEVERQLDILLEAFEQLDARATFFSVGRLTGELPAATWSRITARHELGCHGHDHERVVAQGPAGFRDDLCRARTALEDASGRPIRSFRAPYFSSDGCDPWFGEALAEQGFRFDSSRRLGRPPARFSGTMPLMGSNGAVEEVPLPSVGVGPKRLTVVGGTYFRLLPLRIIESLLAQAAAQGFIPMVYLHPYDIDAAAPRLALPRRGFWGQKAGDWVRRARRDSTLSKLRALSRSYAFGTLEAGVARGAAEAATRPPA